MFHLRFPFIMDCAVTTILNMIISTIFFMILLEFISFDYHLYQRQIKI